MNARADTRPLGIVHDMPATDYFAAPGVSNSMLSALRKSPRHCWALYLDPERPPPAEPTTTMRAGTLAHTAILEPAALPLRYAVKPADHDGRTKEGKAWAAQHGDKELIGIEQMRAAESQMAAVLAVPELSRVLSAGSAEVSIFWTDERTGLPCKARIDWLHTLADRRVIPLDLKTCPDASPAEFGRSVWTWGYYRQAAHYSAGLAACGLDVAAFLFAAVSNAYPYIAVPYLLDDEATRRGADEVRELLDTYAECSRMNTWAAYGDGVQVLSLPAWAK